MDGIGPKLATLLSRLVPPAPHAGEARLLDLLWHFPTGVVDRRAQPTIISAVPGTIATLCVTIGRHAKPGRGSRAPYRITCSDGTGSIDLIYFRADPRRIADLAPEGSTRLISGKLEAYGDKLQMPHPDHVIAPEAAHKLPLLEPIYPLTAGVSQRIVAKAVAGALARTAPLPEWHEPTLAAQRAWPDWLTSIRAVHVPQEPEDISHQGPAWQRLAYDELLAHQVTLHLVRTLARTSGGRPLLGTGETQARIAQALPFELTDGQRGAVAEIHADLAAPATMLRLLQGDVGSGKTVVALMAMAPAFDNGAQAALMAPTEVLARQHAETITPLARDAGLTVGLLTGREKGRARTALLKQVRAGEVDLLIGTHALFQPDEPCHALG
ncbi:MAG: DEAD/DEAH box helicase, partial [Pseudomonadota bacterium]